MALGLRKIRLALTVGFLAFFALRVLRYWVYMYNFEGNAMQHLVRKVDEEFHTMAYAKCAASSDPSQYSAKSIVRNAYDRAYRPFVDRCKPGIPYLEGCVMNATDESSPWWLTGLFRYPRHLYLAEYHKLWFEDPMLRFCRIEKVASSQWLQIYIKYHQTKVKLPMPPAPPGTVRVPVAPGWTRDTDDAPQVVFFRDPLERFLSAYIDKCEKLSEGGKHCQPESDELRWIRSGYSKRQAFASYIYTFPLRWDVHFVPQALYCDGLFRSIQSYSFVGSMQDDRFVEDLSRLIDTYPGKLMDFVRKEFNFSLNATNFREELDKRQKKLDERFNKSVIVHQTGSTQKLLEYYDANTVRQVLEYYAIDYVTLNLEIPEWVQEVLDRDCEQRFRVRSVLTGTGQ